MAKKERFEASIVLEKKLWLKFKAKCVGEGVSASSVVERLISGHMTRSGRKRR